MTILKRGTGSWSMRGTWGCVGLALGLMLFASGVCAQAQQNEKAANPGGDASVYQTIYLTHTTQQNAAYDILTDLRNMLPRARVYYVPSQCAISLRGTEEEIAQARRVVADLDRARKVYRLTYAVTEMDGGKRLGTQHVALIAVDGQKITLKQGNRVPIVTGKSDSGHVGVSTQVQYLDVGLNIETTVEGTVLVSKVEQSSVTEAQQSVNVQDPIIRQTTLQGTSPLGMGKQVVLGSLDIPGSTRHLEIAVTAEPVS